MRSKLTFKAVTFFFFFTPFLLMAKGEAPKTDKKSEIKAYIQHHLQDSYDFSLFSYTTAKGEHKYIGAALPVILWDEGLKIFASSKFPLIFSSRFFPIGECAQQTRRIQRLIRARSTSHHSTSAVAKCLDCVRLTSPDLRLDAG